VNGRAKALRAGSAALEITPAVGSMLQGYGVRYAEGVSDPLLATALAVGHESPAWLLLTVDVIGLDRPFTRRVRNSIGRRLRISPSAVTISCSHTHSGPATLGRLGPVPADESYLDLLERKLIAAAEAAAARLQPARWRVGGTELRENVNRRLRTGGRVQLDVDPSGPVDHRLRVLRLDRAGPLGSRPPLAVIVHYACHATTSGGGTLVSADWPGAMRTELESFYGGSRGAPSIHFLQGCAGNITHRIGRDRAHWPEHYGQDSIVQSRILGRLAGEAAIVACERSAEFVPLELNAGCRAVRLPLRRRLGAEPTSIQVVVLGPSLEGSDAAGQRVWFVGLPGEPFAEYGRSFAAEMGRRFGAHTERTLISGYTNDSVGYFCTREALQEGGYEAEGGHRVYHRRAPFGAGVESVLLEAMVLTAERLIAGRAASGRSRMHWLRPLLAGARRM
jgi:hypothetical protein